MKPLLAQKNAAVGQLQVIKGGRGKKPFTNPYSPGTVAKSKAGRVSDNQSTQKHLSGLSSGEKKTLWYAVGLSLLVIVLFVLAVKYKYIKL